ncbi:CPK2 [Symbiodinium natans]|uniref:CPK2 protein n=1 Tax=Symbiodinium natans TaxID=878477 RepID=A0A812S026_9DINO|nr:CPK2 [Symbiodinium natans]
MAGDVRPPSDKTLWLHPVHLESSPCPMPLRLGHNAPSDHSLFRGELLRRLLNSVVSGSNASEPANCRASQPLDCPVMMDNTQLHVHKGDTEDHLFSIPVLLADVVTAPVQNLTNAQGDAASHLITVAPRPFEVSDEFESSFAPSDEAWIICSSAPDTLMELSLRGAVRWDWKDSFSTCQKLGTGSCGKVLAAKPREELQLPERLRRPDGCCAVKVLKSNVDRTALRSEVLSLASAAGHPNICGFVGVFCEPAEDEEPDASEGSLLKAEDTNAKPEESKPGTCLRWRIVLELLSAGDLFDHVSENGCLPEPEVVQMMLGLFSALNHLHSLQLVHRDVKAENVLFGVNRRAILADFGISCELDDTAAMQSRVGSPGYVAPEVIMNKQYDEKVDIFGAGAVMHFAIDGQVVFRGTSLTQVLRRTVRCKISFAAESFEKISAGILNLLQSLLAKHPVQRPTARAAFSTAWVLASPEVRNGEAKASMTALSCKPALLSTPTAMATKGGALLAASSSINRSTSQTRLGRTAPGNSESQLGVSSFQKSDSFSASMQDDAPPLPRPVPPAARLPEQAAVTFDSPRASIVSRKASQKQTHSMGAHTGMEPTSKKSAWRMVLGLPARLFTPSVKVQPVEKDFHGVSDPQLATVGAQAPRPRSWRLRLFG